MPLANRSTTLNAVVAAAASDIPQGYAFCETSPFVGFVVATTANRAAVGGELAGVAVSVGIAGDAFAGVAVGRCEPEEVGIIGGSGDYVEVTSTGALTRSSTTGANTIGNYLASGAIHVDPALQFGGAVTGNATAIQGVTVSSASGAASYELRGDGTNIRSVFAGKYHLVDFGTVDTTGATSCYAAFAAALAAIPADSTLVLPAGTLKLDGDPLVVSRAGITIEGAGANELTLSGTILSCHPTEPSSSAITYVSHGTSGTKMLRLSGWSGLSASLHTGRRCWIWNSANAGLWIVAKVHNSTTLTLASPSQTLTPVSDATLSGSIRGRIDMPMLELRSRATVLRNVVLQAGASQRCGTLLEIGNPSTVGGGGGSFVTRVCLEGIKLTCASGGSVRVPLVIGAPFVPDSSTTYYSATGQDGTDTTIPLLADTGPRGNGNVSEGSVDGLISGGVGVDCGWYAQIMHGSPSGQSVMWDFRNVTLYGVIDGYLVPARMNGGAHANWDNVTLICNGDAFGFRTYTGNRARVYSRIFSENYGGILADSGAGGSAAPNTFFGCYTRLTAPHPSGAICKISSQGPTVLIGGLMGCSSDSLPWCLVRHESGTAGESGQVCLLGVNIAGTTSYAAGAPARWAGSTTAGIYSLTGTEELDLEEDTLSGGAHIRTFTFTESDLVAACGNTGGYLTDVLMSLPLFGAGAARLNEIYLAHIARVIRYQAAKNGWGITAWVDDDQRQLWWASTTVGATSRIRSTTHARVGKIDMSTIVGVAAVTASGAGPTELSTDTNGTVDNIQTLTPTSINDVAVTTIGVHHQNIAGPSAQQAFPTLVGKVYGTDAIGQNGTIQQRTVTVTITGTGANGTATATGPGIASTAYTLPAALTTATPINIGPTVPANARLLGCEVNVTTKVQNGADTDTTTCDVGISGSVDIAANDISLKSTGRKGESVAGDSTGWVGYMIGTSATQLVINVTSTVNLNTLTAGTFTATVFYWVMP